ncbi:hypothetical protein [Fulvivirga lutimaris]|uniref:hypothetical protein n=1 Tax=Fulvivirga lutimaris TaxID=1819566 RepID=UPI0012BB900A|nr:hypothetical protein [Fulvivirga lutimaris]MTI40263.1 hypothetical protein [Fulvivirga lutimaris]
MTYLRNTLSFLFIILLITGCGQTTTEQQQEQVVTDDIPEEVKIEKALYDDVMDVHDEMMPKMENMMSMKGKLKEKVDLLKEEATQTELVNELEMMIQSLETADEAMMNWMRQFDPETDSLSHEEIVEYYTTQKAKMDSVKVIMVEAIESAAAKLEEL